MSRVTKRTRASRANAARSRGPATDEGKRHSSVNALRHALLSLLQQHIAKLSPIDDVKHSALEEMTAAAGRLHRLWAIETNLFGQAVARNSEPAERTRIAAAFSALAASPELHLLDRYESRLHRMYQRSLHNLLLHREFSAKNPELPNEITDEGCHPRQ